MKAAIIALFLVSLTVSVNAQETRSFSDGHYLYANELKEVIGSKKIAEWGKKDSLVSVEEFKRTLLVRGVYIMPSYDYHDVENFLFQEFGPSRIFIIMYATGFSCPYMLYQACDEEGNNYWNRVCFTESIPVHILSRAIIAGKTK